MPKFEIFTDVGGKYRFRLKAKNGQTIATSQGYGTRANCMKGIESVRVNAPIAEIVEIPASEESEE